MAAPVGNQYAVGHGRPLKFDDPAVLEQKINEYFVSRRITRTVTNKKGESYIEDIELPLTMAGLAEFLDCDRCTLLEYRSRDKFSHLIMRAKAKCQRYAVDQLFLGNDRGAKFVLINDHKSEDWADRTEVNTTLVIDSADAIAQARDRARLLATERLAQIPCGSTQTEQANDYIDAEIDDNTD